MLYVVNATLAGEPVERTLAHSRQDAEKMRDAVVSRGGFAVIGLFTGQLTVERRRGHDLAYVPVSVGHSHDAIEICERLQRTVLAFRAAGEVVRECKVSAVEVDV